MARAADAQGGATRLVSAKAVSDAYPLRGKLRLRGAGAGDERRRRTRRRRGPPGSTRAVLDALGLKVGDPLLLGDASLRLAEVIVIEPDRGAGFASLAPRVLFNAADLPATGLIQPASRVTYRLAVAAERGARRQGRRVRRLGRGRDQATRACAACASSRWRRAGRRCARRSIAPRNSSTSSPCWRRCWPQSRSASPRATSPAAISTTARCCACSACSQRTIAAQYLVEFALVGVVASAVGLALGFAVHFVFLWFLSGLVQVALPPPGLWPALFGVGVGFTLLLGFGLPPVLQLARVPPLRVIRRDVGAMKPASLAVLAAGTLGFAALLLAVSSDLKLGLIAVGGFAGAVCVFALCSWLALIAPAPLGARGRRAALAGPGDPADGGAAGIRGAAGLGARGRPARADPARAAAHRPDLRAGARRRRRTRRTASSSTSSRRRPRRFGPGSKRRASTRYDWYPMIRGRLVAINGKEVSPDDMADARAKRLVEREFNLSHSATLPEHNEVSAGRWQANEAGALSVEEGLAQTLGLKLGDRLRFDLAGSVGRGPDHEPAQGRLVVDARQLLRPLPDRQDGRRAGQLHRRLPRPANPGLRQRARAATSRTSPRSTSRPRSRRSSASSTR